MIYEGNLITPSGAIKDKVFLAPDGKTISQVPQIGWEIIDRPIEDNTLNEKLNTLLAKYEQFPKGLQAQFEPLKVAVIKYLQESDVDSAREVIETSILPVEVEEYRQQFLDLI